MDSSTAARWTGIALASATGYFAINRLYKHVRGRCEPGSDENWVCPGVGAAGALTAGGVAAYIISSSSSSSTPAKDVSSGCCPALGDGNTKLGLPNFSLSN